MKKEQLIIIGGGGHCRSCIDVIEQENHFDIAGIVDMPEKVGDEVLGYSIIAHDGEIPLLVKKYKFFFIALGQIGQPGKRKEIFEQISQQGGQFPVIISPLAYVSKHAKIDYGTIVMHKAIVNAAATVGKNCIINTNALIEHDVTISDFCHISTSAVINGGVSVCEGSFIGSNATSKEYITIAANSFIKANSIIK